jgi:formylglycine-generating enzyme required for sulfatase activity
VEWEYAARGGNKTKGYVYSGSDDIDKVAWYSQNSGRKTHPVGTKQANELGIFDMTGNVSEWIDEKYISYGYTLRGGDYSSSADWCAVSHRSGIKPDSRGNSVGFRLVHDAEAGKVLTPVKVKKAVPAKLEKTEPEKSNNVNPLDMVPVESGTFIGRNGEVTIKNFSIGKYECTQGLWKSVMGSNPSKFAGDDDLPVENVSWNEVQEFIRKLNAKTGKKYRLLSSDEWEFASSGGNKTRSLTYSGGNTLDNVGWYEGNSGYKTHYVGTKKANELGIHDLSGNVREWVYDAWKGGPDREIRGGSWLDGEGECRVTHRSYFAPSGRNEAMGFRLALGPAPDTSAPVRAPLKPADINAIEMVFVKGRAFTGTDGSVTVGDFSISKYEVTQRLWKLVMGKNPSVTKGDDNLPVESVNWDDAHEFVRKLNAKTGKAYRLPTDAEWEFAARGGTKSKGYEYSGSNKAGDVAWYEDNSSGKIHTVGTKVPNELGIHDMSGNVWEWVSDAWKEGTVFRVVRGGSWHGGARGCRVSNRHSGNGKQNRFYDIGFRLAHDGDVGQASTPVKTEKATPVVAAKTEKAAPAAAAKTEKAAPAGTAKEIDVNAIDVVFVKGGTFTGKEIGTATVGDFYIAKYEVTQGLWMTLMGKNSSQFSGDVNLPVENVRWKDVLEFIRKLNAKTGKKYRLPTDAEWEYAARGGNKSKGYKYSGSNDVDEVAWYEDNSEDKTHPVGTKQANELGIHDMSGNVREMTNDAYGREERSGYMRGGSWYGSSGGCFVYGRAVFDRGIAYEDLGFRLALDP